MQDKTDGVPVRIKLPVEYDDRTFTVRQLDGQALIEIEDFSEMGDVEDREYTAGATVEFRMIAEWFVTAINSHAQLTAENERLRAEIRERDDLLEAIRNVRFDKTADHIQLARIEKLLTVSEKV